LSCIRSTCAPDKCISIYSYDFPNGSSIEVINAEVEGAKRSVRCQPTIDPSRPSIETDECLDGPAFEFANATAPAIREYIRKCGPGGRFVKQAISVLEAKLFDQSVSCIRSTCAAENCIPIYEMDFPDGNRVGKLRTEVELAASSTKCKKEADSSPHKTENFCVEFNNKTVCE
jgi:hypothetical protein